MKPQKKSFGAEISTELADTFSDYVEKIGFQKFRSFSVSSSSPSAASLNPSALAGLD